MITFKNLIQDRLSKELNEERAKGAIIVLKGLPFELVIDNNLLPDYLLNDVKNISLN